LIYVRWVIDAAAVRLGDEQFVSLTTFRRSGEPVSSPMWVARDGDALLITTPSGTPKVKRVRRDPRVQLRPSTRFGDVEPGAEVWTGTAEVLDAAPDVRAAHAVLRAKYGLVFRVLTLVERLERSHRTRVILRLTAA
jgi:uncharacterized protein